MLKTSAKNRFLGKYYVIIQPQSASKIQNQLSSPPIGLTPSTTRITVVPKLSPTQWANTIYSLAPQKNSEHPKKPPPYFYVRGKQ